MRQILNVVITLAITIVFVSPAFANDPPVFTTVSAKSVGEGVRLEFDISATDSDPLTLTAEDIPTNATFVDNGDRTGTFRFRPYCDQAGVYNVRFIASDGELADTMIVEITVNEKPVFSIHTTGGYNVVEGTLLTFPVWANDCDETPSLSAQDLPPGATFTDNGDGTGTFDDFIPDIGTAGTEYDVVFTADDGSRTTDLIVRIQVVIDLGVRDTLRLETSGDWEIITFDDSSYAVEVWAWADDDNIVGMFVPLELYMSGDYYDPAQHDSFVVVDTIFKDAAWNPQIHMFRRSVVWNDVDYSDTDSTFGFNGGLIGGVNIWPQDPVFNYATPTKLGDLVLKIRHPEKLPLEFTIEIDSRFYPPAGVLKYIPKNEVHGHPPHLDKLIISVDNLLGYSFLCGDANGSGNVDIDDIVFIVIYMFNGGPAPDPLEIGNVNCLESVDIDDIVYLVNYIFAGGPEPCDPDGDGIPDC